MPFKTQEDEANMNNPKTNYVDVEARITNKLILKM
jgi:hypothetical protein